MEQFEYDLSAKTKDFLGKVNFSEAGECNFAIPSITKIFIEKQNEVFENLVYQLMNIAGHKTLKSLEAAGYKIELRDGKGAFGSRLLSLYYYESKTSRKHIMSFDIYTVFDDGSIKIHAKPLVNEFE